MKKYFPIVIAFILFINCKDNSTSQSESLKTDTIQNTLHTMTMTSDMKKLNFDVHYVVTYKSEKFENSDFKNNNRLREILIEPTITAVIRQYLGDKKSDSIPADLDELIESMAKKELEKENIKLNTLKIEK